MMFKKMVKEVVKVVRTFEGKVWWQLNTMYLIIYKGNI